MNDVEKTRWNAPQKYNIAINTAAGNLLGAYLYKPLSSLYSIYQTLSKLPITK